MYPLNTHFGELLRNIQPPKDRLDAAQSLPLLVRDFLAENRDFHTVSPHTRLVGSYAQDMAVGDVKDVDFLVRVKGDPETNQPKAKQLIQDLRTVLDELPEALKGEGFAELQNVEVEGARRSVHVYFADADFHIDAVPCIAPGGFEDAIYVPDRGFNKWIPSHPIGYIELLNELNNQHSGKVKKLGKLLKHFRNHQMIYMRPKSYWLGALLLHHIRRVEGLNMSLSLAELFRDLLEAIYCQYDHLLYVNDDATPNIPDPLLGHNISWNWGRNDFESFMRHVEDGRKWARNALECQVREEAISYWQRVFGEHYFPSNIDEAASSRALAATPGKSFVSTAGLVTTSPPISGSYVSTKPTTFYGDK